MFWFCSYHRMSTHRSFDPSLVIPPYPATVRFTPARVGQRVTRRAMRDFTGFLVLAWAAAELALWAGGA